MVTAKRAIEDDIEESIFLSTLAAIVMVSPISVVEKLIRLSLWLKGRGSFMHFKC